MLTDNMTVGQRFKKYRTEQGMSQPYVAEGICSSAMVSLLENGKKLPSPRIMGKLAERLGVPLREIMAKDEQGFEVDFQIDMLRVHMEMGDFQHALMLADELEKRTDLLLHQQCELLVNRANCLIKVKRYREAVELLNQFLEQQQVQQNIDDEALCDTFNKLGTAYFWIQDFEKAYSAFEQGYRLSLKLPDYSLVAARVTKNLGLTCNQLGLKDDASRYLEKAYKFYETVSDMKGLASTLFELALATGKSEYMLKARSLYEGLNMLREANMAKQHYAFYVEAKNDYKSALMELESSAVEFEKLGDVGASVYTLARSAMVCIDNHDLLGAARYLDRAEEQKSTMIEENPFLCADFYKAKAMYHLHKGDFTQSILDSQSASQMCDKIGLYVESASALRIAEKAYQQQGMFELAYEVSTKVIEILSRAVRGGARV